jgi:hypothetical protein
MNPTRPLDPCSATTPLSGPSRQPACRGARRGAWATLAQSSLYLLALTMASTGCLVTSTPEFMPPERTRPFLVTATADPDPRGVLLVNTLEQRKDSQVSFVFSADVVSEDQGAKVKGHLYIDYGKRVGDNIYADLITEFPELPPSTMADTTKRNIRGKWNIDSNAPATGCHTVTLIVSHEFDAETSCPVCRNDSSQLTWPVFACPPNTAASECVPDFTECEKWGQGCGAVANPDAGVECGALP